mmetsp:Transcript_75030/g.118588  ORF Transcript_75030/g.118588 Transcript_75030/m.118588 type:complete len:213 (+) Transcript_75030:327-965(+)
MEKRLERIPTPNPMSSNSPKALTASPSASERIVISGVEEFAFEAVATDCVTTSRHAELTKRSFVVITAIVSTPSAFNVSKLAIIEGRCWPVQVGVNAPGMPTRIAVPFVKTSLNANAVPSPPLPITSTSTSGKVAPTSICAGSSTTRLRRKRPKTRLNTPGCASEALSIVSAVIRGTNLKRSTSSDARTISDGRAKDDRFSARWPETVGPYG